MQRSCWSETYRERLRIAWDKAHVLPYLERARTKEDFTALHQRTEHWDTREKLHRLRNQRLVLDKLELANSSEGFEELHDISGNIHTICTVEKAHLAWLKERYSDDLAELPEAILMDPPQYLVRQIRTILHPDLAQPAP